MISALAVLNRVGLHWGLFPCIELLAVKDVITECSLSEFAEKKKLASFLRCSSLLPRNSPQRRVFVNISHLKQYNVLKKVLRMTFCQLRGGVYPNRGCAIPSNHYML